MEELEKVIDSTDSKKFRELMLSSYPDREIYVVMGIDVKARDTIVFDAFFEEKKAEELIQDIFKNRREKGLSYNVVKTSPKEINHYSRPFSNHEDMVKHDIFRIYEKLYHNTFSANI